MTKKILITYKLRERANDNNVEKIFDIRIERETFILRARNIKQLYVRSENDNADSLSLQKTNLQASIN